jgi:hypothetical protein
MGPRKAHAVNDSALSMRPQRMAVLEIPDDTGEAPVDLRGILLGPVRYVSQLSVTLSGNLVPAAEVRRLLTR